MSGRPGGCDGSAKLVDSGLEEILGGKEKHTANRIMGRVLTMLSLSLLFEPT